MQLERRLAAVESGGDVVRGELHQRGALQSRVAAAGERFFQTGGDVRRGQVLVRRGDDER